MKEHRCPNCKKVIKTAGSEQPEKSTFFPFCSERCKLIDLGGWLDEGYRIVRSNSDED